MNGSRERAAGSRRREALRVAALGLPAVLGACGQTAAPGGGAGRSATKREYVVAPLLGDLNQLTTSISRAQPMADFLKKESGLGVRAFAPGDYAGTMIGLADGTIDYGFLPAVLYLRAADESGAQALFRTVRPGPGKAPTPTYSGIIAVRADSGLTGLADLKGKNIAVADPSDAAGWVLPAAHLKKNGVDPAKDARVQYRNSGADALVQLLGKKADAAFAARHDLEHADVLKADPEAATTLKVLATVDNAPLEVVAARKGLDSKVVDTFRAAFKSLGDPAKATYTKDGKTEPILGQWGVTGLVEAKGADFAALREAAKAIGVKLK
jgi:phosphonate transport system substrate-binding protein